MKSPLLCIALIFPLISLAANETQLKPPLPAQASVQLEIISTTPEVTSISLRNPELLTQELAFNGEMCRVATLAGEPFKPDEGSPAVPQVTRLYRIPNAGGVDLVIRNAEFGLINSYKPYPYHEPETTEYRLAESYQRDEWYPPSVAEISAPMVFRDFRIVAVTLNPVQVNPITQQARYYSSIDVDIVANSEPGENELLNRRSPSPRYVPIYRELISNLDETTLDETPQLPGGYLIISRDQVIPNMWADSLAMWRRLSGYDVIIDRRNSWTALQMRTAIRDVYDNSAVPLEYVTLLGDPQAPSFALPTGGNEYDHYFALANDGDELEDIGVGRFPCSSSSELATVFNKLVIYERTPWMHDSLWFQRGLIAASTGLEMTSNATFAQWADQQLRMHTGMDSNVVFLHESPIPEDQLIQILNHGVGLFLWRGSWVNELSLLLPGLLVTNPRLYICGFFTCATGEFDFGTSMSESWVLAGTLANPKGAVAAFGVATYSTQAPYNQTIAAGLVYSMANMHIEHLGHALSASKMWLFRTFGATESGAINHSRWTNLMGDPALSMWTEVPVTFAVDHPLSLPVGARSVALQVLDSVNQTPISDAVVVLWKGEFDTPETYVRALTDDSGRVNIPVTINSSGDLRLAVTKHNHKPYLFNIPCDTIAQQVSVESIFIDDNNVDSTFGNGDGEFNPGEIIDLVVQAHNFGTSAIVVPTGAILTCDNPLVTIVQAAATIPPLLINQTQQADVPFRVSLSPVLQHEEHIQFAFTFDLAGGNNLSSQSYVCKAPKISIAEIGELQDFGPGRTGFFNLSALNDGVVDMQNVTGELISLTPYVRVLQDSTNFGDMPTQQTIWQLESFEVEADSEAFRGQHAEMLLAIVDSAGFRDSVCFEISIGTITHRDPTGPDAYGYYAYDDQDTAYVDCPVFEYLDISEGLGTDLNLNDQGEDVSPTQVWSTAVRLPFPFTYYGASYDTITVCSNGWMAFGNQSWNDCFRNYPMPGISSASNMVAVYWDDLMTSGPDRGVYVYYDSQTSRFIIQWKATGGGYSYSEADLDFQVILFDPVIHTTRDGNGKILFLYQDVQMNLSGSFGYEISGCTVGIQDSGSVIGMQYAYRNTYAPGAAFLADGSAILFTTDDPTLDDSFTTVSPLPKLPQTTQLHPNYPNPFNPTTTIVFDLAAASKTKLTVYNLNGRTVARLLDGYVEAGIHHIEFDGSNLPSSVYFYQLETGGYVEARKMVLLK